MELASVYSNNIDLIDRQIDALNKKKQANILNLLKSKHGQKRLFEYFSKNFHIALCYYHSNVYEPLISRGESNTEVNITFETITKKYLNDNVIGKILDEIIAYEDEEYILESSVYIKNISIPIIEECQSTYDFLTYFECNISNKYNADKYIKKFVQKNIKKIFDSYIVSDDFSYDLFRYLNIIEDTEDSDIREKIIKEFSIKEEDNQIVYGSLREKKEEIYNYIKKIMTDI